MIPKDTIDKIFDSARIEEVVGDFITLKKRGANYLGLCPFHQEKTPSFTVSAPKGIYKCFGCGKAGNSVNFIMDHESLTYPEALKYLAKKYNIEVEEKELSPEEKAQLTERESLHIVSSFAQKWFSEQLLNTDLGKSIGYGYFVERGFTKETIDKFQLGYSPEEKHSFSEAALKAGFKPDYLIKTGLSILPERFANENTIEAQHLFDRYSARVIFPIHNLTGRVIGFGGRILGSDKKLAKYVNSPQSEIYDKSKVLYGLYFAKRSIIQDDVCYLVEGYTDVISMHQAGIENVVSSSGTSLTVEQIRLIQRFTQNITILYDGDSAGIKASFRGIDLILEQGMNVKVLLFPDGDDPDSFSKKVSAEELKEFIKNNAHDFLRFKTDILLKDSEQDPIQKAHFIKEIIDSLALIPDNIQRAVYLKQLAKQLNFDEQDLAIEVNKRVRKRVSDRLKTKTDEQGPIEEFVSSNIEEPDYIEVQEQLQSDTLSGLSPFHECEKNILNYLIKYGNRLINIPFTVPDENGDKVISTMEFSVADYIFFYLQHKEIDFIDPLHREIAGEYYRIMQEERFPEMKEFTHHQNLDIVKLSIELLEEKYELSDGWTKKFGIFTDKLSDNILPHLQRDIAIFREKIVERLMLEEKEKLQSENSEEETQNILVNVIYLEKFKNSLNLQLGRTVVH